MDDEDIGAARRLCLLIGCRLETLFHDYGERYDVISLFDRLSSRQT